MRFYSGLFFVFTALAAFACDGPFPSASKPNVPEDHTESIKGVLHKPGQEHPYLEESGCSDVECHQDDLDGGLGEVDGEPRIAPSCFQCHATLWEDDEDAPEALIYDRILNHPIIKEDAP